MKQINFILTTQANLSILKGGLSPSKKTSIIYFNGKPFKKDENTFYLILKALFVLKIFNIF